MKKALIIAAHPDDAEIAMGGSIAKMIAAGWDVTVVDLTDGEPTPFGSKQIRMREADSANKVLGIQKRICLEMPNRYLQVTLENRRRLAQIIRLTCPDLLFGPVVSDWHPDHVAAAQLVAGARFEAKFHKTDMAGAPYWTPKLYGYYSIHRLWYQKPSFIVDVTDYWNKKIAAVEAYQSQNKNTASAKTASLLEKIEISCRYFGQCIGAKYAEPFVSFEPMGVRNLELLLDS